MKWRNRKKRKISWEELDDQISPELSRTIKKASVLITLEKTLQEITEGD